MFPMRRPPTGGTNPNTNLPSWEEFLPTPTLRQMQMQAALRAAAPRGGGRGWQTGGAVGMKYGGGVRPRPFPPIPPRGDPDRRIPPTPTLREMQMQAAHRGRGPGGWQTGGAVAPTNLGPLPGSPGAQPGYISPYPSGGGPFESTYGIIPQIPSPRQMQMQAAHRGRGPGGWNIGGAVDSTEALMAERDRLQQLLQTADEAMAQEIMAQIMEINKELEMAAAPGMAGGGVASLMGGVRGYQAGGSTNPSDFRYGFEQSGNYPWMPESWRNRVAGLQTSVSGRSLPSYLQQFQTRSGPNVTDILKEQPAWWPESARGWRAWQEPRPGIQGHSVGVAPTGTRNLSGSGGRGG